MKKSRLDRHHKAWPGDDQKGSAWTARAAWLVLHGAAKRAGAAIRTFSRSSVWVNALNIRSMSDHLAQSRMWKHTQVWTKAQLSFSILSRCQDVYSMKCWQVSQRLESCTEGDAVNAIERITTGACKAMIDLMSQPGANGTQVLKWKSQALECGFTSPALAPKPNRIWVASNLWGKRRCSAGNLCVRTSTLQPAFQLQRFYTLARCYFGMIPWPRLGRNSRGPLLWLMLQWNLNFKAKMLKHSTRCHHNHKGTWATDCGQGPLQHCTSPLPSAVHPTQTTDSGSFSRDILLPWGQCFFRRRTTFTIFLKSLRNVNTFQPPTRQHICRNHRCCYWKFKIETSFPALSANHTPFASYQWSQHHLHLSSSLS